MNDRASVTTLLFADIEGSTRLWEQEPERMQRALALHDALARDAVTRCRGTVVKTTGDGFYAAFGDPLGALEAAVALQLALLDPDSTAGLPLRVRCGVHSGTNEHRDDDYFGHDVNRTARIMSAGHGGQILVSAAAFALLRERLPKDVHLVHLGRVRLRDMSEAEELWQVAHPSLPAAFPPLRSLVGTPSNLPQELTSFIGRERELVEVKRLLASTRLLTLTGTGGLGKTRLSLKLARAVLDEYPDGAWFVDLAPVTEGERVPETIAAVLGVREDAGRPLLDALLKFLAERKLLLILDNCEHLVTACGEIVRRLLQAGTGVTVLASSRERLHVDGEHVFEVPALSVPAAGATPDPDALLACEAVRLFRDRAVAAQAAFAITRANAAAVAEICRRLDGIPLALELAAARVRSLSVDTIAKRLDDRFRLLTGGDRTAMARQRTLRALIDWSYDLLDARERAVLQRLAVFAGGWTLEAAESVVAGEHIDAADVLDLLASLVDKSLVVVEAEASRYHLLETVREYAYAQLQSSGAESAVRTRHLEFYVGFAEQARKALIGQEQSAWRARTDAERDNLLAAHAWCARAEGGGLLDLRLATALKRWWTLRGSLALGCDFTMEALARPDVQAPTIERCRAASDAGQLLALTARYAEAQHYLEESLAIARKLGDRNRVAIVLQPLGLSALGQGNADAARQYLSEALALAEQQGDVREIAAACNSLAQAYRAGGDFEHAGPLYARALDGLREVGDDESSCYVQLNVTMLAVEHRDHAVARRTLLDIAAIVERTQSRPTAQSALEVGAGVASSERDWKACARFFAMAELQAKETGLHRDPADDAFLLPRVQAAREALGPAEYARLAEQVRSLTLDDALAELRAWLQRDSSAAGAA